ncbi:uncharacterized protein LOC129741968 [Uranotaenia lowii]|uniref:uncharacterized protein LOC129741968 n=1 Tax=Uranotaenia lowii TaxID=190385 RepID=UPI00247A7EB3|nr:uncharacterized protein LOC129741968 [Uranotaenia lowii]
MGKDRPKRPNKELDTSDDYHDSSDILDRIQSMIDVAIQQVLTKISETKEELQSEIATLRDEMSKYKQECSQSILSVQEDLKLTQNRMLHLTKANDLIITGIPFQTDERLNDIICKISRTLGFSDDGLPLVHARRLARLPIKTTTSPPVLLEFAFKSVRNDFYSRYLKTCNLSLTHIDININRRIYINENLSEHTRKLRGEVLKLKQSGLVLSTFTRDGLVFVKTAAVNEPMLITSIDQIKTPNTNT